MKEIRGHISPFIIAIVCMLCLGSCIYDNYPDGENETNTGMGGREDQTLIVLHISPLDATNTLTNTPIEKIKSLRIIILNESSIECNRLIAFSETSPATAAYFQYVFTWITEPGKKRIYLIANENSVAELKYNNPQNNLPTDLPTSLTALFERYAEIEKDETEQDDDVTVKKPNAEEFKNVMEAVYFAPDYENKAGAIFLPYTSYYDVKTEKEEHLNQTMYLVPVATKFTFKFINNRTSGVQVNGISITKTNTNNFLFANMDESEINMRFADDDKDYYWIDWLAKVAEESHKNQSSVGANEAFNEKYGWIKYYKMPPLTSTDEFVESKFVESANSQTVPAEGTLDLGPFYVPESRYERTYEDAKGTVKEQIYGLTLELDDSRIQFDDVPISNLKALFRNTSVVITITMSEGDVEIYAEIQGWNRKSANGWVTEGQDPN